MKLDASIRWHDGRMSFWTRAGISPRQSSNGALEDR